MNPENEYQRLQAENAKLTEELRIANARIKSLTAGQARVEYSGAYIPEPPVVITDEEADLRTKDSSTTFGTVKDFRTDTRIRQISDGRTGFVTDEFGTNVFGVKFDDGTYKNVEEQNLEEEK